MEKKLYNEKVNCCYYYDKSWGVIYKGRIEQHKRNDQEKIDERPRYVTLGFDDFRASDFTMVIPLLEEYGFHATFNKDSYSVESEEEDRVKRVIESGNELGDHTWFHLAYLYTAPGFNGQNPQKTDGGQIPFPSNDEMRLDRGDGKNVFGYSISDSAADVLGEQYLNFTTSWEQLSDDECQKIREAFSVMMDSDGPINVMDELSNKYLGTVGSSKGSIYRV